MKEHDYHPCGFFGGSLWTSSGHKSSINARIGSEMASMCSNSRFDDKRFWPIFERAQALDVPTGRPGLHFA